MQMSQTNHVYISPTTLSIVYKSVVLLNLYFTNDSYIVTIFDLCVTCTLWGWSNHRVMSISEQVQ